MQALVRATASRGLRQFRHGVRQFASDISHEDHAKEMNKWRIITIAGRHCALFSRLALYSVLMSVLRQ